MLGVVQLSRRMRRHPSPRSIGRFLLLLSPMTLAADWTWQEEPVDVAFWLDDTSTTRIGEGEDLELAASSALRTWSVESNSPLRLQFGGATDAPPSIANRIIVTDTQGSSPIDVVFDIEDTTRIIGCELHLHTQTTDGQVTWSVGSSVAVTGAIDAERALLHGIGRCLGLPTSDAPDDVLSPEIPTGTGPADRHLGSGDIEAAIDTYGAAQLEFGPHSHAVFYDPDVEDGDGRGAPGETFILRARLLNEGDTAWGLEGTVTVESSSATLDMVEDRWTVGDVAPGEHADLRFVGTISTCFPDANPTYFRLELTDERGASTEVQLSPPIQCARELDGEDEPSGCSCGNRPSPAMLFFGLPLGMVWGRRRLSSAGRG